MGNNVSTTENQTQQISFESVKLNNLISSTQYTKTFRAIDQNTEKPLNITIFDFPIHHLSANTLANYHNYLRSITYFHHPSVLCSYNFSLFQREINGVSDQKGILITGYFDGCLHEVFERLLTPYNEDGLDRNEGNPELALNKNLTKSGLNPEFVENDILNMLYNLINAMIYCDWQEVQVSLSERNIILDLSEGRFMFSPFPLADDQAFWLQVEKGTPTGKRKEEDAIRRQIALKKEIFKLGIIALKMATLYSFNNDLKIIRQLLNEIKGTYPTLSRVLNEILINIFNDEYDVHRILKDTLKKHFFLQKLTSKFLPEFFEQNKEDFETVYKEQMDTSFAYTVFNNYEASLKVLQDLTLCHFPLISNTEKLADILEKSGEAYIELKHKAEALDYLQRAITTREAFYEEDKLALGEMNCRVGLLLERNGDFTQAVELLAKASEMLSQPNEQEGKEKLMVYYEKQIEVQIHLLRLKKKALGENHLSLSDSLDLIARNYKKIGKLEEALKYRIMLKDFYKEHFAKKDGTIINYRSKIGGLQYLLKDYDAALKTYKNLLDVISSVVGKDCDKYYLTLNKMGRIYKKKKDYKSALKYFEQASPINPKFSGELNNKKNWSFIICHAKCLDKKGERDKAIALCEQVLENMKTRKMENTVVFELINQKAKSLVREKMIQESKNLMSFLQSNIKAFDTGSETDSPDQKKIPDDVSTEPGTAEALCKPHLEEQCERIEP